MKLHFDRNQEYQIEAVSTVTDLFEGQPVSGGKATPGAVNELLKKKLAS